MIKDEIEKAVADALAALGAGEARFVVERPGDMEHGDYSTNAALAASKIVKKTPREVADLLAAKLSLSVLERVEVAGAGFINFYLTREAIATEVAAAASDPLWGTNTLYANTPVMVEYTDPNPFKEFHIGHLMSNTIGESIARLLEAGGAHVLRANYQGDVGPHVAKGIFGLLELGVTHPTVADLGRAYVLGAARYEESPEDKAKINEINKKIYEKSDEDINVLYDEGRTLSLKHFEDIYETLGTLFDRYYFESETGPRGLKIVHAHPKVFVESEGATVFKGEDRGLHTRVFINSQGLPTYETKELGLIDQKWHSGDELDFSITVTANEQSEYFKVVLAAAAEVPELADAAQKTKHIVHGMMRFAEGKMSSRTGNVITGESLLADLAEEAQAKMEGRELADPNKVAEQIAVGAIKYVVLKQSSSKDIIFDPAKSLSLEGDSGPYLQYARVRALSLLEKASKVKEVEYKKAELDNDFIEFGLGYRLKRVLVHFPDVISRAAVELEPHYITTYLTELASVFNGWYGTERIIVDGEIGAGYPDLIKAVENTLTKGLQVLGIPAPEEM